MKAMDINIDEKDCGMSDNTVGGVRCDLIATLQNMFTSNSPERQMKRRTEGKIRAVYNIYHIVTWNKEALIFFENCITQDTESKLIYAFIWRGLKYGNSTVVNMIINTNQAKNTLYICSVHIWNRATQCVVVVVGSSNGIFFACLCWLQAHPHLHRIHSHTHTCTPNLISHSCPTLLFLTSPI